MKRLFRCSLIVLAVLLLIPAAASAESGSSKAYPLPEQRGGSIRAVIWDHYAYVADASVFSVIDISAPLNMRKLAQLDLSEPILEMQAADGCAWLMTSNHFYILDISEPGYPVLQADMLIHTDDGMLGFCIDDSRLLLFDQTDILTYALNDPARPVPLGTYHIGGTSEGTAITDAAVRGGVAYVSMGYDGTEIYDFNDPNDVTYIGSCSGEKGYHAGVDFFGSLAFLRIAESDIVGVIDITDLKHPVMLQAVQGIRPGLDSRVMAADGHFALLPDAGDKIHVIDVSDLSDIKEAGCIDTTGPIAAICCEGESVYAVEESGSLRVIDMTKPPFVKTDPNQKIAYITIDDGPFKNYTARMLDTLKKYDVKATFFVVPKSGLDALYQRIIDEGHVLGNHSYSHDYGYVFGSTVNFEKDLLRARNFILDRFDYTTTVYRFPGGTMGRGKNTISSRAEILTKYGYRYFDWNVSTADTDPNLKTYGSTADIVNILVNNVLWNTRGAKRVIVLMHDGKSYTAQALPKIIEGLQKQGYIFDVLTNY